jgi:gas vesicle protein
LDSIKGDKMMKADTENETANYVHEAARKSKERSDSLTRTDLVNKDNWSNKFATFLVGVGIGALIGLPFAPAPGKKTRNHITRTVKQGLDDAASTGKRWSRRAQETVDDMKSNVVDVVEAGQKAYRSARDA